MKTTEQQKAQAVINMQNKIDRARETLLFCRDSFDKIFKQYKSGQHCICNEAADKINEALAEIEKDTCPKCGGSGKKPRKTHCSFGSNLCPKTHTGITCHPDGVQCEYYIASEPCPDCQPAELQDEVLNNAREDAIKASHLPPEITKNFNTEIKNGQVELTPKPAESEAYTARKGE